jgi:ribose 5-phosphate isomerase B
MKFAIGSDHGGLAVKQALAEMLRQRGHEIADMGTHDNNSVDYPVYGAKVAEMVSTGDAERGVLVCGTGIGMSIIANKFPHVRAALVTDEYMAQMASEHNNANILVLGGRSGDPAQGTSLVATWLDTPYEGGRHQRRLDKIAEIEHQIRNAKE